MNELQAGKTVKLVVDQEADYGFFLTNDEQNVLLHKNEMTSDIEVGQEVEVFLYIDKQGRMAASMSLPTVQIGKYDWATVTDVQPKLGAFVNIGIQKEILVSIDDLPLYTSVWPEAGDKLYVTLSTDKQGRLLAIPATEDEIMSIASHAPDELNNQNLSGYVYRIGKVGAFMITDAGYRGFIHESEMKQEPRLGQLIYPRVIKVKEDGSLNLSLLPRKQESIPEDADVLLSYMENRGGGMPYGDKSNPDDIQLQFGMSKSAFKRALGGLIKEKKVYQAEGWTHLQKKN